MINRIEFNQTGNILLNSGIIGLDIYLDKYRKNNSLNPIEFKSELYKDKLIIESESLYQLLEQVYYLMGKDIYDTSGKRARRMSMIKENPFSIRFRPGIIPALVMGAPVLISDRLDFLVYIGIYACADEDVMAFLHDFIPLTYSFLVHHGDLESVFDHDSYRLFFELYYFIVQRNHHLSAGLDEGILQLVGDSPP